MSTAEIAIVISIVSVFCAALSLGWNIYRDVVLKPKVRVGFGIFNQVRPNYQAESARKFLCITATNFGPGAVTINHIYVRDTSFWKKLRGETQLGFMFDNYKSGIGEKLPKRLAVGEKADLVLLYGRECFLSEKWTHIGVSDTFGRLHSAERRDVDKARGRWMQDFGNKAKPSASANGKAAE